MAATCYALLALAWIVDLLTPQLFIAAILLNGPIALSALALRPSLTLRLTLVAELANVVAGYANGVQAGGHWVPLALANRALVALSFLLVGFLTLRAQAAAHRAGATDARERRMQDERALRRALESVRATLSLELVLRAAARAALSLTGAVQATVFWRESPFDTPTCYEIAAGGDVSVTRRALEPATASALARADALGHVVALDDDRALVGGAGQPASIGRLRIDACELGVAIRWGDRDAPERQRPLVQALLDNLAVALRHVRLVERLEAQRAEIQRQNAEIGARGEVIRDIVYALAHDLRTPLVAADVTMHQALEGAYGVLPPAYAEIVQSSVASNARLRQMVETLLLVARYESGEDSRAFADLDLGAIVTEVVGEMREVARLRGVTLKVRCAGAPSLYADGGEIRRAIENLVANALEATPAGGSVEVSAHADGPGAVLEVRDDGFGVPAERRATLFERFGGTRAGGGSGLGLYIVRRIAEKYGGEARYAPREPRGSRFSLTLPKGRP